MKVTLTIDADELKIVQLLSKFAEKYNLSYKLNRQAKGYLLEAELNGDDFGEFIRRLNHIKDATFKIEEIRGGGLLDKFNVGLTRTNVDALIGKEAIAKTDIDPLDGGVTKLQGELWLSRPENPTVIKEGSRVRVIRVEGVSLIVEGVDEKECMKLEITLAIVGFVIAIVVLILLSLSLKKVNQYEKGLVERFNAYEKTVDPGLRILTPFIERLYRVNMREQVIDVPPQEIITEDNVVVTIDAVIYYQVVDAKRALYEIEDFELAIVKLAQTTLRNIVGEMSLDIALTSREKINVDLRSVLDQATDKWGTKVNRIELQRIDPPADIQTAMHKQKTAEQERRQLRLLATGRKEAAEQEKLGTILKAQGEKQSAILKAEGDARAVELVADAQAKAIKAVSESANLYFKDNAQLNKKLDVIRDTFSQQTKIIVPSSADILNVIGLEGATVVPIKTKQNEAASS